MKFHKYAWTIVRVYRTMYFYLLFSPYFPAFKIYYEQRTSMFHRTGIFKLAFLESRNKWDKKIRKRSLNNHSSGHGYRG